MTVRKANWVAGLDLVRFSAAFLVACYHLFYLPNERDAPSEVTAILGFGHGVPALSGMAWFGWIGVEIFFVMSGFVIALTSQTQGPFGFLKGRFLRLYPAVWICATCTLVAALTVKPPAEMIQPYLHSVTLFPFFPYVDVVYWTLGIEMAFYALVFAILLSGQRQWISKSFFLLGLASTLFWALWIVETVTGRSILHALPQRLLQLSLLQHGCFFAIGGLLWLRKHRRTSLVETLLAALFLATCLVEIGFHAQSSLTGGPLVPCLVWLAFVLLMALFVFRPMHVEGEFLPYWIRLAGLTTYPLYLLHQVCGATLLYWLSRAGVAPVPSLVIAFALVLILAGTVAGLIEPLVRFYTDRLIVAVRERAQRRFARAD